MMGQLAQRRAEYLGDNYRFLVGEFRAGAHIAPNDSFDSLCGTPCLNRQPNHRLEKTCKKCKAIAERIAMENVTKDDDNE